MGEKWKQIDGFCGMYEVSNHGNIRSVRTGKTMKLAVTKHGYNQISFRTDGKKKNAFVHRLVAEAFIPNPEKKREVNHKNGIKTDNRAENLEWVSRGENQHHAYDVGLRNAMNEEHNQMVVIAIKAISGESEEYSSQNEASRRLGINQGSIARSIKTGRRAGGYKFLKKRENKC